MWSILPFQVPPACDALWTQARRNAGGLSRFSPLFETLEMGKRMAEKDGRAVLVLWGKEKRRNSEASAIAPRILGILLCLDPWILSKGLECDSGTMV